jgi:threonine dehydratase
MAQRRLSPTISRIIERGMVESGRFVHLTAILKDKPGHLEKVLQIITELQGNIMDISLGHMGENIYPGYAQLSLSVETRDQQHIEHIFMTLKKRGYSPNIVL